jgi:hypothetical protein
MSKEEIEKINGFVKNPKMPKYLFNRKVDIETGEDKHLTGSDLELQKEFDIGTIQPIKMIADEKGATLLRWEIPEIEPYEERIISYKVKARLKVLGNFSLPPALAKFKSRSAELKVRSKHGTIMQK